MAASIEISEERGVRYLHFGSHWIQGAMRIARPHALELEYTRDMMLPLLLHRRTRWPRRVLSIGLGAASVNKFLYRHRPKARQVVVEIDPDVVNAARQFFKLPDDPRQVVVEVGDGNDFVASTAGEFDLILVDGFDAQGRAGMLETPAFYRNARARLSNKGLLVSNFLTRSRRETFSLEPIRDAFDDRAMALPISASGNAIVVAASGDRIDLSRAELTAAARMLQRDTGLNLLPMVARLMSARHGVDDRLRL